MRKINEQNERIKREYLRYLRHVDGLDERSLDKVRAALLDFEQALAFKPFKSFHRDWAETYKRYLAKRRSARTGNVLSVSTRDSLLRQVRGFFAWLATQPGYKSRITYSDVRYFNNTAKDARVAHTSQPPRYPSLEQCAHAFRHMPAESPVQRRDRAIFALALLTGARANAVASLRLHHVDLADGYVYQDARNVRTKAAKTIETWFLPLDPRYVEALEGWICELKERLHFGPTDALFPKCRSIAKDGKFINGGFESDPYATGLQVNRVIKRAFVAVGMYPFTPHSFRKTLALAMDKRCSNLEESKALSQNIGHDHLATTLGSYMPVTRERQREIIRGLRDRS